MTTTTQLPLNAQAQAMLRAFHRQAGIVPGTVEQSIAQQANQNVQAGGTAVAIDCDALEKILLQAMPDKTQAVAAAKGTATTYHCDTTNGRFLTQILSMRIEKETANVYSPPVPTPPVARDPLYATFSMAPDADVMLLFNARDVDDKGQPLLMKVVARDRFDINNLDLTHYRTQAGNTPDVVRVKDGASYVETKDIHESEFAFGDPLKQVSLNGKGQELSTSVWVRPENLDLQKYYRPGIVNNRWAADLTQPLPQFDRRTTGDTLDKTPVKSFSERVRVSLQTNNLQRGAWLDTAATGGAVKAELVVGRGYIFEPGSRGLVSIGSQSSVQFVSGNVGVSVAKDDAHLLGNTPATAQLSIHPSATLRQVLSSTVSHKTYAQDGASDAADRQTTLQQLVFADAAGRTIAGRVMSPLEDVTLVQSDLAAAKMACTCKPLPRDPEEDGVTVKLTLDDGFLATATGQTASFKGYTMVVGFTDVDGTWKEQSRTVNSDASKHESFSFDVDAFDEMQKKNGNLEVRLFNADNVPAMRVLVPFREIHWGN